MSPKYTALPYKKKKNHSVRLLFFFFFFTLQYEKCNRVVNMNVSACGRVPSTLSVLASMGYAPQCTNDIRQRHYGTTVVKPFLSVFGACVARHAYGKGLGSVAASTTLV